MSALTLPPQERCDVCGEWLTEPGLTTRCRRRHQTRRNVRRILDQHPTMLWDEPRRDARQRGSPAR